VFISVGSGAVAVENEPPPVAREFRGAWVATVSNIDWPTKPGLSSAEQQRELLAILDRAVELGLNAIVLQIRPACDALYESQLEPWSPFLTGTMGQPPVPEYDPLEFAISEAHRRGIELHVWLNPYRALHPSFDGEVSSDHVSKRHPEWVRKCGDYLWLDPGVPDVADHTVAVILDVANRYDIDGVHMDDYFYPYPVNDKDGKEVPFPDDESYARAVAVNPNTPTDRGDWRRENVNRLVERLNREIHELKPWVKFGISPFGIWRPGHPESIAGFDQYDKLYADARKWLSEGWVDYFSPQLYWPIDQKPQSYPVLLQWWRDQNQQNRHLWPGNFTSRVSDRSEKAWPADEIINQIEITRRQVKEPGNIHFSMKTLMRDRDGLSTGLRDKVYAEPALVPAVPWLAGDTPPPTLETISHRSSGKISKLVPTEHSQPWRWVLQKFDGKKWVTEIHPGTAREFDVPPDSQRIDVFLVDRFGRQTLPIEILLP
jgi:uncharacterized lipoprotein YddW (UPF0748 family)